MLQSSNNSMPLEALNLTTAIVQHDSHDPIYDPTGNAATLMAETLFYIGCKNADGATSDQSVVDRTYDGFTDLSKGVKKVKPGTADLSASKLKYDHTASCGTETTSLLTQGEGRCGAWARFFRECCGAQGIDVEVNDLEEPVQPDMTLLDWCANQKYNAGTASFTPAGKNSGIRVKNWNINDYGFSANPTTGVEGQGNPEPESDFTEHAVVLFSGKIYDPSYGAAVQSGIASWQLLSLAALDYDVVVSYKDTLGAPVSQQKTWNHTMSAVAPHCTLVPSP
jgi:hypothetical protein